MLSVLMTAFLSFSYVSGATITKELESEQQDKIVRLSSETAVPQPKFLMVNTMPIGGETGL